MIDFLLRIADKLALAASVAALVWCIWADVEEVKQVELDRRQAMADARVLNKAMRSNDDVWPPKPLDEAGASGKVLIHWKDAPQVAPLHPADLGP